MDIIFFILPILVFPACYILACLFLGKKGKPQKKIKKLNKLRSDYSSYLKFALTLFIVLIFLTVLKEEIITENLTQKDIIILLLMVLAAIGILKMEKNEDA